MRPPPKGKTVYAWLTAAGNALLRCKFLGPQGLTAGGAKQSHCFRLVPTLEIDAPTLGEGRCRVEACYRLGKVDRGNRYLWFSSEHHQFGPHQPLY